MIAHRLAPMSGGIRWLTLVLLASPVLFFALALRGGETAPVLRMIGCALVALPLGVVLYSRPLRFELGAQAFAIVWPIRRRVVGYDGLTRVRVMGVREFAGEFGNSPRIGVGGLFGVFGWLYSFRVGLVDISVSRLDGWVVIEQREGRPLVISPEEPERFVAAVREGAGIPE